MNNQPIKSDQVSNQTRPKRANRNIAAFSRILFPFLFRTGNTPLEALIWGLTRLMLEAVQEQEHTHRDVLLQEFRGLYSRHPDDEKVREVLAWGLSNTMADAAHEHNFELRDALHEELSILYARHGDVAGKPASLQAHMAPLG